MKFINVTCSELFQFLLINNCQLTEQKYLIVYSLNEKSKERIDLYWCIIWDYLPSVQWNDSFEVSRSKVKTTSTYPIKSLWSLYWLFFNACVRWTCQFFKSVLYCNLLNMKVISLVSQIFLVSSDIRRTCSLDYFWNSKWYFYFL